MGMRGICICFDHGTPAGYIHHSGEAGNYSLQERIIRLRGFSSLSETTGKALENREETVLAHRLLSGESSHQKDIHCRR